MKTKNFMLIRSKSSSALIFCALFFASALFFNSCKDKHMETRTYTANSPVYMSYEEARDIRMQEPGKLEHPGKIMVYGNYLFVNEVKKGIHIIDNSNPSNPQFLGFLKVPGNIDIAVKENTLYLDNYFDLVAVDISDVRSPKVTARIENTFSYTVPQYNPDFPMAKVEEDKGIVTGWEVKEVTETCVNQDCDQYYNPYQIDSRFSGEGGQILPASGEGSGNKSSAEGVAGSMARFMVYQDQLYTIYDGNSLKLFNISSITNPVYNTVVNVGNWNIETLFTYKNNLFIGSEGGMLIYNLSNPASPQHVSEFQHAQGCDPVVVYEDFAYVTLRSGNECGGWSDQLDVIDISEINNPRRVNTISMSNPYGLGIDGEKKALFVCDGLSGIKVYDSEMVRENNWDNEPLLTEITGYDAFDVIPLNGLLIMVGKDGFYQYDYSDLNNISELGKISFDL